MIRSRSERIDAVWKVIRAARRVAAVRSQWIDDLVRTTGLSREGVVLGFERHLELEPAQADLEQLVAGTPEAPEVHVILSAHVFTAALRALAVAHAAAPRVWLRPSRSEPVFAGALVDALEEPSTTLIESCDPVCVTHGEIHVYGRDKTIATIRARAPVGVVVRGHGTGFGVALIFATDDPLQAAEALARDIIAFDQRGCMSPRITCVEGNIEDAEHFGHALSDALSSAARLIPRGQLLAEERVQSARYDQTLAFAGTIIRGQDHLIGVCPATAPVMLPPPGRHMHVVAVPRMGDVAAVLSPLKRFVVVVGSSDAARAASLIPRGARGCSLGEMQRPPLDGPVDRR